MKLFKGLCALALVGGLTYPAYAEVQNVKVGGDITTRGFLKSDFDLRNAQTGNVATGTSDDAAFWASFTHVGINADLTDNVSAEVGISNQRLWAFSPSTASELGDIDLFSSYLTLKEFLYSPLTITVGLQPLRFGKQFIVGDGLLADPSGGISSGSTADGNVTKGTLATNGLGFQGAREYSILNYYNAIRGTLDYNPWTIDAVYSAISETVRTNNDQTLWGVNVGYDFSSYSAEAEGYWFYKDDQAYNLTLHPGPNQPTQGRNFEINQVHTLGLRGSVEPITSFKLDGEVAFQTGEIVDTDDDGGPPGLFTRQTRNRRAWAANVSGEYNFDVIYSPTLGLGWVFYSGEEPAVDENGAKPNGSFGAWDPMYRGSFFTAIQEFLGGYQAANLYGTNDPDDTAASTNRHQLRLFGSAKPLESLKLDLAWVRAYFDEKPIAGRDSHAGDEIDAKLTYDYTEDVQLSLLGAWFIPGQYYDGQTTASSKSTDTASEIAASVSVMF